MQSLALSPAAMNNHAAAIGAPTPKPLLSLMNFYEQGEGLDEGEESETELMVLLSGMVAVDLDALHGD